MTEDEARRIELVRAVEVEDREGTLLTREDREQADAHARAVSGDAAGSRRFAHRYLAARSDFAAARLTTRHQGLADLLKASRWPGWVGFAVPVIALIAGFLANELGNGRRMNLLAVPLIGTIAWNLAVYAWIAASAILRRRSGAARDPLTMLLARAGGVGRAPDAQGSPTGRAAAAFRRRWSALTARLNAARAARTLHLGAALFAAGLILGIYARAIVIEYRAGWESTFLGPAAVHWLLSMVLGPASAVSGVEIPSVAEIDAMRWDDGGGAGVNAAPWIHLYTITVAGLVIAPRLLLALAQGLNAARLSRSLPVASREDFYVRRLLRASGAAPGRARVTPYAYAPGEETRRRLTAALRGVLGDGAEVRFDPAIPYGGEDGWATAHPPDPEEDYHLLLFTLSSTPEAENHGEFARLLAGTTARAKGTIMGALIDETPWRAHFAGQPGLDERVATRLAAWRSVLAPAGIAPLGIDLTDVQDDDLAKRIEASLIPDAELHR